MVAHDLRARGALSDSRHDPSPRRHRGRRLRRATPRSHRRRVRAGSVRHLSQPGGGRRPSLRSRELHERRSAPGVARWRSDGCRRGPPRRTRGRRALVRPAAGLHRRQQRHGDEHVRGARRVRIHGRESSASARARSTRRRTTIPHARRAIPSLTHPRTSSARSSSRISWPTTRDGGSGPSSHGRSTTSARTRDPGSSCRISFASCARLRRTDRFASATSRPVATTRTCETSRGRTSLWRPHPSCHIRRVQRGIGRFALGHGDSRGVVGRARQTHSFHRDRRVAHPSNGPARHRGRCLAPQVRHRMGACGVVRQDDRRHGRRRAR